MPQQGYSWDGIRQDLKRIDAHNPNFLANTVLVGGAACWYYRLGLTKAGDPDFPLPSYTAEQERVWLSKDLDFMADSPQEISELIGAPCPPMGKLVVYGGATLDFIETGLKMTSEAATRTARKVRAEDLVFYIASPSLLFAEKTACVSQKNRPQDPLHREVLARFIKMELCRNLEQPAELDTKDWLAQARDAKSADLQFFTRDAALRRRLHTSAPTLAREHRAITHWVRHHVPPPVG
jgi:hypothetical protein